MTTATIDIPIWKYLNGGLSIIPVNPQTKRPLGQWKQFQERIPTSMEVEGWLSDGLQSIAVVCGAVSGGLEILDIDDNSNETPYTANDFWYPLRDAIGHLIEQYNLPVWRTGGNGYQFAYRCEQVDGNLKLAWVPNEAQTHGRSVAIETRGQGGYAVVPPSLHPSGQRYELLSGDLCNVPTIPVAVREEILSGARSLCLMPYTKCEVLSVRQEAILRHQNDGTSVIDAFNQRHNIGDLLAQHGYTEGHRGRYSRPGQPDSMGVVVVDDISFHWSSNDPLHRVNGSGRPLPIDAFNVYTEFEHNGDVRKAIKSAAEAMGMAHEPGQRQKIPTIEWTTTPEEEGERNPLDVDIKDDLNLGWIDDCTAFMHELTGSQVNFNRLTAIVTAATAIQRKARVNMSFGSIYPNCYGCIVAPSTSYRKSTAAGQAPKFLNTAMLDDLMIPAHGSTEGLMQQLSETPNALMLRDEIAPMLASDRVKYLKDLKQVLTELYGCEPVKRRLRTEEVKIHSPYLNILGATTPEKFYSSTTPGDWADGFLPRFLWALPEGEPYWDAMPTMMSIDTIARMQQMVVPLMKFEQKKETDFILQGESLSMWSAWKIAGEKAAFKADDENAAAIIGRYGIYAMKFSLILASVNDSWGIITEETMQTAIHLADNYKAVAYQLLSEADNHKVTGSNIMKCFTVIQRKSAELGRGVTPREVGQYTSLRKKQYQPCLDKLDDIGAVMWKKVGRTKQYITTIDELQPRKWN